MFDAFDTEAMEAALRAAESASGTTRPNPSVGAAVARGGRILSVAATAPGGRPHAEPQALAAAGDARGATLYCTLEPCNHTGATPPCTEAIIAAGVTRVVIAARDRNPVARGGIERLRAAGIPVEDGLLATRARLVNPGFHTRHELGRPLVTVKWAMTLDGCTSAPGGDSKWITDAAARREAHAMRAAHDATLAGIGTVERDGARLSIRDAATPPGPPVRRIVLDAGARVGTTSAFIREPAGRATVACAPDAPELARAALVGAGADVWVLPRDARGGVSITALLERCAEEGVSSVLVEGGRRVAGHFLEDGLVDRIAAFIAPRILGAGAENIGPLRLYSPSDAIAAAVSLHHVSTRASGSAILVEGWVTTHLFGEGDPPA